MEHTDSYPIHYSHALLALTLSLDALLKWGKVKAGTIIRPTWHGTQDIVI